MSAELAAVAYEDGKLAMATTVVAAVFDSDQVSVVWTDDSTCWMLADGWHPIHDLPDETADGLHTGLVKAIPSSSPVCHERSFGIEGPVFLMTDGVGEPLRLSEEVSAQLAEWWQVPPDAFTFARQVAFTRSTLVDDRTVVGVWPRLTRSED